MAESGLAPFSGNVLPERVSISPVYPQALSVSPPGPPLPFFPSSASLSPTPPTVRRSDRLHRSEPRNTTPIKKHFPQIGLWQLVLRANLNVTNLASQIESDLN